MTRQSDDARGPSDEARRITRVVVAVILVATVAVGSWAWWRDGASTDPTVTSSTAHERESKAASVRQQTASAVLAAWNERRARAWAEGDLTALAALYVGGAARTDVSHLRRWLARGLVVEGLTTQVLRADVRRFTDSTLTVEVTDRVASGTARAVGGATSEASGRALPRDGPQTTVLTMRRVGGQWLLASAAPVVRG